MTAITRKFSRRFLCLAVIAACAGTAFAGPAGFVVSAGSASYAPATLTVTSTTARTQISWRSFNVAASEVVKFVQPDAESAVLNIVFSPRSLNILGGLSSNGRVLFMSNGIVAGAGMNLDLAGVINTSLRLPRMALALRGIAPVAQPHSLTTLADGRIYVIGEDAQAVTAANGEVVLNPGKTIELANASMPNLRVGLTAPHAEAINLSRLVGSKGDTGIFAGLFRVPAAARQASERDVDAVLTASAEEHMPSNPDIERFYRYALLYARMRSEAPQDEGGLMKVAAASSSRLVLPAARSRPSLLPQAIEIGAPSQRSRETAVALATLPVAAAPESESERNNATLLALAPILPAAEVVATQEPQPILLRPPLEPEDIRTLAGSQLAAVQSPAPPKLAQASGADGDAVQGRKERRAAPAVTVVALAKHSATPAPQEDSNVKEVRIERRAPRYFTDYRGAMFFM
jgi:filamentous hemagglutinin family protein